ncbi:MAG: hypothetical protein OWU84_05720 [Firmicutes bacterium]|nr:hypothetical protein [Bacillota bacterium]
MTEAPRVVNSPDSSTRILGVNHPGLSLLRLSMTFFALVDVAAHLFASPGSTPIVTYWIDVETATYGLIGVVYLLGLRRYYLLPVLFTCYNMFMYFLTGFVSLPFGIDPKPLVGHLQFASYSFGRGMSLIAWLYLLVVGLIMLKKDPGSKLNRLLDED